MLFIELTIFTHFKTLYIKYKAELFGEGHDSPDWDDYEPYGMGQFGITGGTNIFNNIQGGQINMDYVAYNTIRFEITEPTTTV